MSVMSSLRRQVYGVPPYKGARGRAWMKAERDSRVDVLRRAEATRDNERAKRIERTERRFLKTVRTIEEMIASAMRESGSQ